MLNGHRRPRAVPPLVVRIHPFVFAIVLAAVLAPDAFAAERLREGCFDAGLGRFRYEEGIPPCEAGEHPALLIDGDKIELLPEGPAASWPESAPALWRLVILMIVIAPALLLLVVGVLVLRAARGRGRSAALGAALLFAGIVVFVATCRLAGQPVGWPR